VTKSHDVVYGHGVGRKFVPEYLAMEPQENPELIGQAAAERALLAAARSGRLAHGWLLAGPRGVGKATLAYRFARFLLAGSGGEEGGLFGEQPSETLALDPGHPVFRRIASGAHPDLRRVARGVNPRTGRPRSEIVVDDVREAIAFLRLTPSEGGWRVVIVDGAEDMNRNAANALLKVLEEPPARAILLLVSHAPGRLLPTIRSRCRKLELPALAPEALGELLARAIPDLADADRQLAAALSEGSIGRAMTLAQADGIKLYRELADLLLSLPRIDAASLHRQADRLVRGGAEETFRLAGELLIGWLARMLRLAATGNAGVEILPGEVACMRRLGARGGAARWVEFIEAAQRQFDLVDALNLDRRQVWIATLLGLQRMAGA
jgi:DNA polymerase-3 subunit delta'